MQDISLATEQIRMPSNIIPDALALVRPLITVMQQAKDAAYETDFALLHAPFDVAMQTQIKRVIAIKKALMPKIVVVIGIGGSNLGTMAVIQALFGCFYNEMLRDMRIFFADTVDADYVHDIVSMVEKTLQRGETVLLNVVTKSGTTTETVAHFYIFLELLRSFYPHDYHKYIVVTTDAGSPLYVCAHQHAITVLEIPKKIGGRYSVFTAVGLFPLGLVGVDTDALLKGARRMIDHCLQPEESNIALRSATARHYLYTRQLKINDLFVFSVDLEGVGKWYRQLMGESIGKEHDLHGKKVEAGITPMVSVGTTDLHSVGQLYLGGPRDKLTVFVDVAKARSHCYVPKPAICNDLVAHINGKSIAVLNHAILEGVCAAYRNVQRPYMTLTIPSKSAFYIGQLLQYMMIEMIYLGTLLEVNPFDQPNVEMYKQETRKILSNE